LRAEFRWLCVGGYPDRRQMSTWVRGEQLLESARQGSSCSNERHLAPDPALRQRTNRYRRAGFISPSENVGTTCPRSRRAPAFAFRIASENLCVVQFELPGVKIIRTERSMSHVGARGLPYLTQAREWIFPLGHLSQIHVLLRVDSLLRWCSRRCLVPRRIFRLRD
jgi:hypothetical protein